MYEPVASTAPSRHPERARYDEATVHSILDEALVGHLAFVADGAPQLLPLLFVREGGSIYLHSSTGARPARLAVRRRGLSVSFEVTLIDGLVLARSMFHHSVNYRSVVVHGTASMVADEATKRRVLEQLVEKVAPGRSVDARAPDRGELRQTAMLELPLETVSAKVRAGDPVDDERDLASRCWAGVVRFSCERRDPEPSADLAAGIRVPAYLEPSAPDGASASRRRPARAAPA
ncbi:MAG: pyridoxamine 5'-phosphate oxidase family protein [Actinomycetota bacterium]|nr:pyridoxamine 5'-phosphate oxidase family protein [Actinomycetota bacterium]